MITTVVGNYPKIPNLPRPARLRKAMADFEAGKISSDDLHRAEDEVTLEVIAEQIDAGIDLITDGKIRWEDEQTHLARKLRGFSIDGLIRYFDSNTYYRQPICEARVVWTEPITVRDYEFAVKHSVKPVKAALTGPYTLARLSTNKHYASLEDFVIALAGALHQEARALERAGATFIQFDEPAILRHKSDWPVFEEAMKRLTHGLVAKLALYTYFGDVDGIYPQILSLPFAVIGLDFVQGAQNWSVIKRAPFSKELGLGIVDARNTRLESVEELHRAFDKISRIVPLDKVQVSPTSGLEFLPRERAQEKLVNMVEAAKSYTAASEKAKVKRPVPSTRSGQARSKAKGARGKKKSVKRETKGRKASKPKAHRRVARRQA